MKRRTSSDPEGIAHLVVIGSSAGGIDALAALVSTLPTDFPAPIILAQHLDPRRESHLSDILRRRSTLPVRTVTDREQLVPGVIFAVPADRHVVITDHEVRLQHDGDRGMPRPSIDRALSSAADAYGEGLVAVILTGAGSDGAAGARAVKAMGGTVVIQNPETASFPAMPLSLSPTTVDVVAELEAIGPLLHELVTGAYVPRKPDEEGLLTAFLDDVRESTGIDFTQYKRPTILRRLQRRMVATGTTQLRDYVRLAQQRPDEMQRLTNSFLIKVTEFFRDPDLYDYLRDQVLPDLIRHAAATTGELRFWSAGCATGEEAYSLAIATAAVLASIGQDVRFRIFATDVDAEAIDFARRGVYPAAVVERVPKDLRDRYFVESGGSYEVSPVIRGYVAFGQHDLAQRAPFPRIDLAICRNVLIYFTSELQRRALQLFAFSLRDDGYLIVGKAETTSPFPENFVLEQPRLKVFRRRGSRVILPATRFAAQQVVGPVIRSGGRGRLSQEVGTRVATELERARTQAARADQIVMRLPVGIALVDRKYDIAMLNGAARDLLGVYGAAIGQDLVHLVHGIPSTELRRDIDSAFRGEPARSLWDITTADSTSGEVMSLEVTCYRQGDGAVGTDEMVMLLVRDVTRERGETAELANALRAERERAARLGEQIERMADAAQRLREANNELTTVNADLRLQNDDLVVSNEEVQAATEEVETLNEEMHATNEELETLNEELQATVEELNTTNDDLEARTTELQNLAFTLERQRELSESERARLSAILVSMADAVIVVDEAGNAILTNDAYEQTFGSGGTLLDETGKAIPESGMPRRRAARGETFSLAFSMPTADDGRRWFEASGRPLDGENVQGGVVVIRDVTDRSLQQLQTEFVAMLSHELRTPLTGVSAYLEMLERELRKNPSGDLHRYADRALGQVRRFGSLISELFDANRLRSGHMTFTFRPVDLRALVEDAVAVAQPAAATREIRLESSPDPLRVRADAARLEQVVLNLLTNAITHAPGPEPIEVRVLRDGDAATVSVRDHGPGLSRTRVRELFSGEPEMARAATGSDGLGLGLYIARQVVEAHHGTIRVETRRGAGATFTVSLPLEQPAAPRREAARPGVPRPGGKAGTAASGSS